MRAHTSSKKIVLLRPSYSIIYLLFGKLPKRREVRPPIGLLSIAGALIEHGHQVEVIDGEPELLDNPELIRRILKIDPDFLGVTSTTPEIPIVRDLLREIKKLRPQMVTILGGAHASAIPEETMEYIPDLDYLVVGEGEEAIIDIVDNLPQERIITAAPIKDLDNLPFPAKHLVNPAHYSYPHPDRGMVTLDAMETSRGCPHNCIFCFHLKTNTLRFKSPERVWEELRQGKALFGSSMLMFYDDTFTFNEKRASTILQGIIDIQVNNKYHCFTRADALTPNLARLMREAGFVKLTLGVETGDPEMLKRLKKGTTLDQYQKAFRMCAEAGMETRGSFMVGNPYETWDSVWKSIEFARSLDLYRIGVNIATPYPGTRLHQQAMAKDGVELLETDWSNYKRWGRAVVRTPGLSAQDLEKAQILFLREFFTNPKILRYHLGRFLQGNRSLYYYRPLLWSLGHKARHPFWGGKKG